MNPKILLPPLASVLFAAPLHAEVQPNALFSEGAVLQRGQTIPVWGTANEGEKVTVEFAGQTATTTTASSGKWRVDLQPLEAGGPFTMKISGDNTVTVNNLLVGEVWVASGQSNMAWTFSRAHNAAKEAPKATYPKIRMFTVKQTIAVTPRQNPVGSWVECSPQTVNRFSAVGYFFARDLHRKLGVPVGIIHSSWGGTPAEAWTSLEGFGSSPELQEYVSAAKQRIASRDADAAAFAEQVKKHQTRLKEWNKTVEKPFLEAMKAWNTAAAEAKRAGTPAPPKPKLATPKPEAPRHPAGQRHPTVLYNGMIAPIIPYGIKGVIWYQGEGNAGKARQYRTLFPAMISDWRSRWKLGDFPFLYVQIAPFKNQPPEIREAQFLTLAKAANTAMTVTTDVGDANDIHPTKKEPVGQRLALAARALAYGEKIEYSGPLYDSMSTTNGKIILNFKHCGGGLVAKDGGLKGFTIAGESGNFVPAKAEIQGSTVVVSADGVATPKAVRYGWENVPDVNLFNQEGLPASPFRTDVD